MKANHCILIPIYNNRETIRSVVEEVYAHGLHILIVDDGSNEETRQVLRSLQDEGLAEILTRDANGGKGGAVIDGFRHAHNNGFTHALQMDADGQHDSNDVPSYLAASASSPTAIIAGSPIFDQSIPKSRLHGRKITVFWANLETLSTSIHDPLNGYRMYPLGGVIKVCDKYRIGKRMEFDCDLIVKSYWEGIPIINLKTKVIYPEGGISHFRLIRDNMRISAMHTRLFFGMLIRIPKLLKLRNVGE